MRDYHRLFLETQPDGSHSMTPSSQDRFSLFSSSILVVLIAMSLIVLFMLGSTLPENEETSRPAMGEALIATVDLPADVVTPKSHYVADESTGQKNPFYTDYFVPKLSPKPKVMPPPQTVQIPVAFQGMVKLSKGDSIVYLIVDGTLKTFSLEDVVLPGWTLKDASVAAIELENENGTKLQISFRETAPLEIPRINK